MSLRCVSQGVNLKRKFEHSFRKFNPSTGPGTRGYRFCLKVIPFVCRTQVAHKIGLHVRQIVLKNIIYLLVQHIHTYPLYETMHHLMMFCTYNYMMFLSTILLFMQSGCDHFV